MFRAKDKRDNRFVSYAFDREKEGGQRAWVNGKPMNNRKKSDIRRAEEGVMREKGWGNGGFEMMMSL